MRGGYGNWIASYGPIPNNLWIHALKDIDSKTIQRGVLKAVNQKRERKGFPPNIEQFIALCAASPEDIGAPDFEDAYREACNLGKDKLQKSTTGPMMTVGKEWTHPAIYNAYKKIEGWTFITNDKQKREIFATKYNLMIERIARGEQLTDPGLILSIKHNPSGVVTEDNISKGEQALAEMRARLG